MRGAFTKLSSLDPDVRAAGVVAASAGNHGQAVAWAARELGAPARVFMPQDSPMAKVDATRSYGAEVELGGHAIEDSIEAAMAYVEETGGTFIHPFEDPVIISGQGTIGLEIAEQVDELETVLIPIGGGGLASGISLALRAVRPGLRIIGVQAAGTRPGGSGFTIADGIAVKKPGELTMGILSETLDEIVVRRGRADRAGDGAPRRAHEVRRRRRGRGRRRRAPQRRGRRETGRRSRSSPAATSTRHSWCR